jgi:single-strand DNA-binding protein
MRDVNTVCITGRLTRDCEQAHGMTKFSVANNWQKKENEVWIDMVNYFDCIFWGKLAEVLAPKLTKGTKVTVSGMMRQSHYSDSNGNKKSSWNLYVGDISLESGRADAHFQDDPKPAKRPARDMDEDIPF